MGENINNGGSMLKCPRPSCLHKWSYKGEAELFTSCPKCRTTVTIKHKRGN